MRLPKNAVADESAVTSIEYSLIAGIASVVIITAVSSMGRTLNKFFVTLSAAL
jgi:Flp pilus assembly pilin Flp